jgi:hypothetical protein
MQLQKIVDELGLTPLTIPADYSRVTPESGYCSDLLSCVMAGSKERCVWVTLQAHINIVAVAALREMAAVIITEGAMPDSPTIIKANEEGIPLFSTLEPSYAVVGKLWEMGLRGF